MAQSPTRRAAQAKAKRASLPVDIRPLPQSETRTTELIGVDEDGVMSLWSVGEVRPITAFRTTDEGRWIKSGHYVIDWKGHAITVHCGNLINGGVSVLFMCSAGNGTSMTRAEVEAMLIGEVVPDPKIEANILRQLEELSAILKRRNQAPHRLRGRIGGGT
jgi:hypothetical protein